MLQIYSVLYDFKCELPRASSNWIGVLERGSLDAHSHIFFCYLNLLSSFGEVGEGFLKYVFKRGLHNHFKVVNSNGYWLLRWWLYWVSGVGDDGDNDKDDGDDDNDDGVDDDDDKAERDVVLT